MAVAVKMHYLPIIFKVLYKTQLLIGGIASVYQLVKIKDVFDTCGELLAAKKHPPPAPLICEVN